MLKMSRESDSPGFFYAQMQKILIISVNRILVTNYIRNYVWEMPGAAQLILQCR